MKYNLDIKYYSLVFLTLFYTVVIKTFLVK